MPTKEYRIYVKGILSFGFPLPRNFLGLGIFLICTLAIVNKELIIKYNEYMPRKKK
jgi:hypothetical protein